MYINCIWLDHVVNKRKLYLRHECQEICVFQWISNSIPYVKYVSSISWYSTCRELQYPRHGCYDLNTSEILPSNRYLSRGVPQEFAFTRTICVSHHRWHSSISCVLYVWITIMTKISIISYFIGLKVKFSMIRAFMIFCHYFLSAMRNR